MCITANEIAQQTIENLLTSSKALALAADSVTINGRLADYKGYAICACSHLNAAMTILNAHPELYDELNGHATLVFMQRWASTHTPVAVEL